MPFVKSVAIEHGYRTDHSMIVLHCSFNTFERGRGIWRFNNSLLRDHDYVNLVKSVIKRTLNQYSTTPVNDIRNLENENISYHIDDQLLFETLLMEIRGETIKYTSKKKKIKDKEEREIEVKIKLLKNLIDNGEGQKIIELEENENKLKELRAKHLEGVMVRSRARWVENGEKPTKYFCGLEKRNFVNKTIDKIELGDGTIITDQKLILKEVEKFYTKLYSNENLENVDFSSLDLGAHPVLPDNLSESLEGPLTIEEIKETLKNMKNDKTPGICGYSAEFFKFFFKDLGFLLQKSLNHGYSSGTMSVTQRQGLITCLPKGSKPRKFLKNWRPITLLSVPYKIASGAIANRIKKVLHLLIHEDQKGFVKGRFIGENIRFIYDILNVTENQQIPGCLVLIDFEKAFDTISWNFMQKTLKHFNFGQSICKWIKTFYNNITASVMQSGFLSNFFPVFKGCRQGDPLSPYLFILCAEILALLIRSNKDIQGIHLNGKENKLSQFADDTSLTLDGSEKALSTTFHVLNKFRKISGLKVNFEKTKIVWIGSKKHSNDRICPNLNLDWCDGQFDSLGVTFSVDLDRMINLNYSKVKNEVTKLLSQWQKRNLTILGKITVVKTLAVSKLSYYLLTLPNPNNQYFEEIQKMFYKFIWGNKPDKIRRAQLIQEYSLGGLKMVNILEFARALKATWLRRIIKDSSNWSNILELIIPCKIPITDVGSIYLQKVIQNIKNDFWKDVLQSWKKVLVLYEKRKSHETVYSESIWLNDNIKIEGKPVMYKTWYDRGIRCIYDLLDDSHHVLNHQNFLQRFDIRVNFLTYHGIIMAVESYIKSLNITPSGISYPYITPQTLLLISSVKGCKDFYSILIADKEEPPNCQTKWENIIDSTSVNWKTVHQMPFKTCVDAKLKCFQHRFINRILATKSFLHKINITDSPLCEMCNQEVETIEHVFLYCTKTESFWTKFVDLIHRKTNNRIYLDNKIKIFGVTLKERMFNMLLIMAKKFIYSCKIRKIDLDIKSFIAEVKNVYSIEQYYFRKNMKTDEFKKRWAGWKHMWKIIDST